MERTHILVLHAVVAALFPVAALLVSCSDGEPGPEASVECPSPTPTATVTPAGPPPTFDGPAYSTGVARAMTALPTVEARFIAPYNNGCKDYLSLPTLPVALGDVHAHEVNFDELLDETRSILTATISGVRFEREQTLATLVDITLVAGRPLEGSEVRLYGGPTSNPGGDVFLQYDFTERFAIGDRILLFLSSIGLKSGQPPLQASFQGAIPIRNNRVVDNAASRSLDLAGLPVDEATRRILSRYRADRLTQLVDTSAFIFIGTVESMQAASNGGFPVKLIRYRAGVEPVLGQPPTTAIDVTAVREGPNLASSPDDERPGERSLVFVSTAAPPYAASRVVKIDGDRIAPGVAATDLGIAGMTVAEVTAELQSLATR